MKLIKILQALSFYALLITQGYSQHLGVYGHTFAIGETNLIDLIQHRLKAMEKTGELAAWQKSVVTQVKKSMVAPPGVKLNTTTQPEVFYYTPSFTLGRDIVDHLGRLIYPKGLTVNALDNSTYPKVLQGFNPIPGFYHMQLIFINGKDEDQLQWVASKLKQLNQNNNHYKVVLTDGNLVYANKSLQINTRFDQGGFLIQQFGIKAVPSIVDIDPKAKRLKITEISAHVLHSNEVVNA